MLCEANEGAWDNEVDDADDMFDNTNDSLTHDHDQLFAGDKLWTLEMENIRCHDLISI